MQPIALNAALYFLQSAYKSLARSQRLRITKSFWLSDWYCGMRVKSTNCCAKDGFKSASATLGGLIHLMQQVFANLVMSAQINSENDGGGGGG